MAAIATTPFERLFTEARQRGFRVALLRERTGSSRELQLVLCLLDEHRVPCARWYAGDSLDLAALEIAWRHWKVRL